MQRIFFLCLIVLLLWAANSDIQQNCDHLGMLLYEDLGCTPLYEEGKNCPTKFGCEPFTSSNESCLFRGKRYNIGEEIEDNLITENCFFDCKCVDPAGFLKYECDFMNCTEWSQHYNTTICYKKYDVEECCSTGIICPSKEKEVHVCQFEGTRYREGELFIPSNTCSKCSCQKGFTGKIEEPYCRRSLCGTQIENLEELEHYCAPLYLPSDGDSALCCPNEWVCYSANDTIAKVNPNVHSDLDSFCNFGPELVKLGEGINRLYDYYGDYMNVTCECILPPLLTCRRAE